MQVDSQRKDRIKCRVAIVGAGASGLYCAHLLCQDGALQAEDLIILEARDRIGGRIHSKQEELTCFGESTNSKVKFHVDYGAAWVHGTGYEWPEDNDTYHDTSKPPIPEPNPMMELLEKAYGQDLYTKHLKPTSRKGNLWMRPKYVLHDDDDIVLYVGGKRLERHDEHIEESLRKKKKILKEVSNIGNEMFENGEGMETVRQSLKQTIRMVKGRHSHPVRDDSERLVNALVEFYMHLMEAWYGCPATELQLSEFTEDESDDEADMDELYTREGDYYGPHCTLRYGMQTLLEPLLADGVGDRVKLCQHVSQIEESKDCKTVIVESASGLVVEAECVVVSVPLGCLKEAIGEQQHMFRPPLSDDKQEAIKSLRMGQYKKVDLTFDRIFWDEKEALIGLVRHVGGSTDDSSPLGDNLFLHNLWARDGIPRIEAVLISSAAVWATGRDTKMIRDAVLDFMIDSMGISGDVYDWCVDCHVTRWEEDPYSRGAYSSFTLGTLERHPSALREPDWTGKLILVGECTVSEFEGSVHAALLSGRSGANQVKDYLSKKSRMAVL